MVSSLFWGNHQIYTDVMGQLLTGIVIGVIFTVWALYKILHYKGRQLTEPELQAQREANLRRANETYYATGPRPHSVTR